MYDDAGALYLSTRRRQGLVYEDSPAAAGRVAGLNVSAFLQHCQKKPIPSYLSASATAIGAERGTRIGAEAAKVFVYEARQYATNMIANNAPWLVGVEAIDE